MGAVDILIPTRNRPGALAVTLTALASQTWPVFRVVVSDQSADEACLQTPELRTIYRLLEAQARVVVCHRHLPRRGMAEHRAFLLEQAHGDYALFLDDDVILERDMVERMIHVMRRERCGFVGSGLIGLSFLHDVRPHEQAIEFWDRGVEPECVEPGSPAWARHRLHNAANLYHLQRRLGLTRSTERLYRVAWIGGCVLYDTAKLRAAGGFDFWRQLPCEHCGEDVLAQIRVMRRYGGCGLLPSGAYHQELPTTVSERTTDAPKVLPL